MKTSLPSTPRRCRFAVADGATEAFDARNWAERLAQHWVEHDSALTVEDFRQWVAGEGRELHDSWNGLTLSWYSEEKARDGSFAAFAAWTRSRNRLAVVESRSARRHLFAALPARNVTEEFASLPVGKFQHSSGAGRIRLIVA